jgi:hypothetical protein
MSGLHTEATHKVSLQQCHHTELHASLPCAAFTFTCDAHKRLLGGCLKTIRDTSISLGNICRQEAREGVRSMQCPVIRYEADKLDSPSPGQ